MSRKDFYNSKAWKVSKNTIWLRQNLLCAKCGRPVYIKGLSETSGKRLKGIVHHIEHLNDINVYDDNIALNEDNLIGLCIDCHNTIHGNSPVREGLMFDETGNLVSSKSRL